jgi:hypothetical protein
MVLGLMYERMKPLHDVNDDRATHGSLHIGGGMDIIFPASSLVRPTGPSQFDVRTLSP